MCVLCAIESRRMTRIAGVDCVRELHDAVRALESEETILSSAITDSTSANYGEQKSEKNGEGIEEMTQNLAGVIIIGMCSAVGKLMRSATTTGTP